MSKVQHKIISECTKSIKNSRIFQTCYKHNTLKQVIDKKELMRS